VTNCCFLALIRELIILSTYITLALKFKYDERPSAIHTHPASKRVIDIFLLRITIKYQLHGLMVLSSYLNTVVRETVIAWVSNIVYIWRLILKNVDSPNILSLETSNCKHIVTLWVSIYFLLPRIHWVPLIYVLFSNNRCRACSDNAQE
jgi:hypothetical protein